MTKILFLTHWYPSATNPHKGIFIKNHAKCFNTFSNLIIVDFSIEYSNKIYSKNIGSQIDENGINTVRIQIKSRFYKILYYFIAYQKCILLQALKREKIRIESFECIVSNIIFPNGIVSWKLAKKYNKPLYHIEHWSNFETFLDNDFHRNKGRKFLEYVKKIIVVSEVLKKSVEKYVPNEKIAVIPNVVAPGFSFQAKNTNGEETVFLAIANWRAPKNPYLFLQALDKIGKEKNLRLIMIGVGPQLDKVKSSTWTFKIDFHENMPQGDLEQYYHQADFFVHGSDYETFSLVPIEALISGTPVIASKVGVLPQVINETNGVLCENTFEDWYKGILKAINKNFDHYEISESIKNKFSYELITQKFKEVIEE